MKFDNIQDLFDALKPGDILVYNECVYLLLFGQKKLFSMTISMPCLRIEKLEILRTTTSITHNHLSNLNLLK